MASSSALVDALAQPLALPCGLTAPNRLVKAALEEIQAPVGGGDPTKELFTLYRRWGAGGYGIILTGNVSVSPKHLGSPFDVTLPDPLSPTYPASVARFKTWAQAAHPEGGKSLFLMQLNHPGRQSSRGSGRGLTEPSLAPSAVQVRMGKGLIAAVAAKVVFPTPKAMSALDIEQLVQQFVHGAKLAKEAGFQGVQLHCAHGYLLAQFLSPNVNLRTDEFGGDPRKRMTLLLKIISAIRAELPASSGFLLSIKLNSADYVSDGLQEEDALNNVRWIAEHGGVDLIEVSGGTYENAEMLKDHPEDVKETAGDRIAPKSDRTAKREAFFVSFASQARTMLDALPKDSLPTSKPAIMVTGGFRTRLGMADAVTSGAADFIGLGRPACADPDLPKTILDPKLADAEARAPKYTVKGTGLIRSLPLQILRPGTNTVFHTLLLIQIGKGGEPQLGTNMLFGMLALILQGLAGSAWLALGRWMQSPYVLAVVVAGVMGAKLSTI